MPAPLPESVYESFPIFDYNAKTFFGNIIQDVFGRTKPHKVDFDSRHRVKVNFYNVDYFFFASAGINVKMQKKGWTGIWRKLRTEELRLGWDVMDFEANISQLLPQPRVAQLSFDKINLGKVDFASMTWNMFGKNLAEPINSFINNAPNQALKYVAKSVWSEVKKLAPSQWAAQDRYVKSFRLIYPDKIRTLVGRYEFVAYDTDEITKNFDWNAGVAVKLRFETTGNVTFSGPMPYTPISYKIHRGSMFGAAKYNGVWKGAYVDKAY